MVILQQLKPQPLSTFGDLSETILRSISKGKLIYSVTDQYLPDSIKSHERARRVADGNISIQIEQQSQKAPIQWNKYLRDGENKTEFIQFLLDDWSLNIHFRLLQGKTLFFNCKSKFFKITCQADQV